MVSIKLLHECFRINLNEQTESVLYQHLILYDCIDFDPALSALEPDLLHCQVTDFKSCPN